MKQGLDKGTLFMAILISFVAVILADMFLLSFVVHFPTNKDFNEVTQALKEPFELYAISKNTELFLPLQLISIAAVIFLSFKLYKLILGEGKYKDASNYGSEGTARFAKPVEVFNDKDFVKKTFNKSPLKNLENPEGLIFGLLDDKPVILPGNTEIPNRNIAIVGSPGSGKTQSYLLTNLLAERNRSMVITDPKGEIYEASAKFKKEQHGYEIRLVNFKEMLISDRYNPIDYITKEVEAEEVANTIVLNSMNGQKPDFWTKAEIALLKTLLLYVKYECPTEANLANVKRILTTHGSTPEKMDTFFKRLEPDHPAFSAYQIVAMASDKVRDSIFVSLAITLSKFDASDVRKFTETSDFQLDDIGKRKMIVYVILPVADSTWEPLIANFFTQMFQRLYDVADRNFNKLPVPVNLFLDEFPNLGTIPGYEERLATCRSYGISCSTIIQSIGQLIDKYNKEKAEAIIGNCSLRYLLGVSDKLTAEYFSDLIGKTTIGKHSKSVSKNDKGGSDSKSDSYSGRNLVMADELTRTPRDEAILLVSGGHSIKLKKAFQFKFFKDILNDKNKSSRFDYLELAAADASQDTVPENVEQDNIKEELVLEGRTKEKFTLEDFVEEEEFIEKTDFNNKNKFIDKEKDGNVKEAILANMFSANQMLANYEDKNSVLEEEEKSLDLEPELEDDLNLDLPLEPELEDDLNLDLPLEPEYEDLDLPLEPEYEDLDLPLGPDLDELNYSSLESDLANELSQLEEGLENPEEKNREMSMEFER
ncbi:VirD4-like conjugal transfer protein, CD1115 family [Bacillus sp. 445_BSPC]|uniref:VirD4-like conjugal transfer protein, CD1115 family n=1 Tax=Bacillus sp. 445_BSPC TaxID=1581712 RepID=UPI0006621731|nr:type IV secretory system conjugative DNA transfer family protein [Bacillus sp. 445_BSPC]